MNFLKNNWWKIFLGIIFIWFCYGVVVYFNMPNGDKYVVVDKIEQMASNSTGKHSSELVLRTFVRVQYENGDYETLRIDDPFVARYYVVGQNYIQEKYHVSLGSDNFLAFSGLFFGGIFLISVGLTALISLCITEKVFGDI